jgi:hypothetical protein
MDNSSWRYRFYSDSGSHAMRHVETYSQTPASKGCRSGIGESSGDWLILAGNSRTCRRFRVAGGYTMARTTVKSCFHSLFDSCCCVYQSRNALDAPEMPPDSLHCLLGWLQQSVVARSASCFSCCSTSPDSPFSCRVIVNSDGVLPLREDALDQWL